MKTEIERKFLVSKLPNLNGIEKIPYERYFLFYDEYSEIRIQKKEWIYEFERKIKENDLLAKKQKIEITEDEFMSLRKWSTWEIFRDSYSISSSPNMSLKTYHWDLEWFNRIEVEFASEREAQDFEIPDWLGEEITGTKLARDSSLIWLSLEDINEIFN